MDLAILSVSFLAFLLLGVPVSFALGLSCVLTYLHEGLPAATAMQSMISGMNAFSFLAVPFFILSGELMLHGGIADRIPASRNHWWGTSAVAWAWPTWWPARCSAASRARPPPTRPPWAAW